MTFRWCSLLSVPFRCQPLVLHTHRLAKRTLVPDLFSKLPPDSHSTMICLPAAQKHENSAGTATCQQGVCVLLRLPGYATAAGDCCHAGTAAAQLLSCLALTFWHQLLHLCCKACVQLCRHQPTKAAAKQHSVADASGLPPAAMQACLWHTLQYSSCYG